MPGQWDWLIIHVSIVMVPTEWFRQWLGLLCTYFLPALTISEFWYWHGTKSSLLRRQRNNCWPEGLNEEEPIYFVWGRDQLSINKKLFLNRWPCRSTMYPIKTNSELYIYLRSLSSPIPLGEHTQSQSYYDSLMVYITTQMVVMDDHDNHRLSHVCSSCWTACSIIMYMPMPVPLSLLL